MSVYLTKEGALRHVLTLLEVLYVPVKMALFLIVTISLVKVKLSICV